MEKKSCNLAILGGGPGGYSAAIMAAKKGISVILIEKEKLGGTCLNRGCIPWKTLIATANILTKAKKHGIENATIDYQKMKTRKNSVLTRIQGGLNQLIQLNKISVIKGEGKFVSQKEIEVDGNIISADNIIIATGSEPRNFNAFPFDFKFIHDSTSILEIDRLPKSLAIIGGGVIGCEAASLYSALGVKVTIFEALEEILPTHCTCLSSVLKKHFQKRGIEIKTGVKIEAIEKTSDGVSIKYGEGSLDADASLVVIGRKLNTDNIDLEKAGVVVESKTVKVDDKMETNIPGIYAIGDITGKQMLAHLATHQGIVAAKNILGFDTKIDYGSVPSVVFTDPEIASVGITVSEGKEKGIDTAVAKFPFSALGKAHAAMETDGFAQIVFEKSTKTILGAQVIGENASELIAEITLAVNSKLKLDDITETIHAHPTFSECWMEAGLIGKGSPLHFYA